MDIPVGVARIGENAFSGCSYLLRVEIQGGEIGERAFDGCSSLTTVDLMDKVTDIGYAAFRDHTVSYKENIGAGTASVIVTGSGGYTGEKTADFTIQKAPGAVTASNITRTASKKVQSFSIGARAKGGAQLSYQSDTKAVAVDSRGKVMIAKNFAGRAVITITANAAADYSEAVKKITVTVKATRIRPGKTALTSASVSAKSRKMALRWKKAADATGYQIQYATDRKFTKGAKKINVPGASKRSKVIGKRVKGKRYYVRIRAYRKTGGKIVYSAWSGIRRTTMKK